MAGCVTNTATVHLTAAGGILSADVQVSADAGNNLSAHADGLYAAGAPAGAVVAFAGAVAPAGWLLCDGGAVSRATYAALYAIVGTLYGVGDGSTTFNVPDMRGRVIAGYAAAGHADVATLGNNEGSALANRRPKHPHTHTLTLPTHVHSITDPGHTHTVATSDTGGLGSLVNGTTASGTFATGGATTGITVGAPTSAPAINGAVGAAGTANDAPAYLVLNFILKY